MKFIQQKIQKLNIKDYTNEGLVENELKELGGKNEYIRKIKTSN